MSKEVQWFITRTQQAIDNDGLMGISGIRFDKGGTPMDVLKSKVIGVRFERRIGLQDQPKTSKPITVAMIAKSMNAIQDCMDVDDNKPIFKKRKAAGLMYGVQAPKPFVFDDGIESAAKAYFADKLGRDPNTPVTDEELDEYRKLSEYASDLIDNVSIE